MSINAIANAITQAASGYINQTAASSPNSPSSALAEASESPATTAKEAAKGDKVAKRLLAKEQEAKKLEEPAPAQEPGKGEVIDQKA